MATPTAAPERRTRYDRARRLLGESPEGDPIRRERMRFNFHAGAPAAAGGRSR
ncbi:MAG: hypothetical protein HKN12_06165 [Gemmatimonadetes bacterium]|nr:hypothetical protein [Gemmatimonadota bacterium]